MLIPDEIRKCVVFVCSNSASAGIQPRGTAFLFATMIAHEHNLVRVDVVTAKHVIIGIRESLTTDGQVLLRLNLRDGGTHVMVTQPGHWHLDPSADVAVLNAEISSKDFDVKYLSASISAADDVIMKHRIGIGDDVFITGLFVNHYGANNNIPILRVGNIAAVPSEPVSTGMGPMPAYLIEARSIGGLSGSPVFVYLDPFRMGAGPKGSILVSSGEGPIGGASFLLGLIHGHYDVQAPAEAEPDGGLKEQAINMGIAIVVPVAQVIATINAAVGGTSYLIKRA